MTKIRRGGFIFVTWIGDHRPRHVHVYRDSELVVKWDLENDRTMEGHAPRQVRELLETLREEGRL